MNFESESKSKNCKSHNHNLDWEDKDTDLNIGKRFNKLARSFDDFNPPISIKIRNRFTDLYINNLVLACYNVKAFGAPAEWLRKK